MNRAVKRKLVSKQRLNKARVKRLQARNKSTWFVYNKLIEIEELNANEQQLAAISK